MSTSDWFSFVTARTNRRGSAAHAREANDGGGLGAAALGEGAARGGGARPCKAIRWPLAACLAAVLAGCGGGETLSKNDLPVHCLAEPDAGPCKARLKRYFYDYRYDRCRTFQYGGCQGHAPFETLKECEETCVAGGK